MIIICMYLCVYISSNNIRPERKAVSILLVQNGDYRCFLSCFWVVERQCSSLLAVFCFGEYIGD